MKKNIITLFIVISIIGVVFTVYHFSKDNIDYAIEYAKVFGSYDIALVDEYLNNDTIIVYKGTAKTYNELRSNIITAFNEKKYTMANDSSYGYGDFLLVNGVRTIGIQSYVNIDGESVANYIVMKLEKKGINSFRVQSLSSDDEFFGYLFHGE